MSRVAMAAWYTDTCVNAPLPVMSAIAHSLSRAGIRSSVPMAAAISSMP
jgi:hypothetical protein